MIVICDTDDLRTQFSEAEKVVGTLASGTDSVRTIVANTK